jgi:hypothetical protein
MPKIDTINESCDAPTTCVLGVITSDYSRLVAKLGPPKDAFGEHKTDAEWIIRFEEGSVATIYNWKDGKNYLGDDGLEVSEITEWRVGGWHVGGEGERVVTWVDDFINNSWPICDDIRQEAQF